MYKYWSNEVMCTVALVPRAATIFQEARQFGWPPQKSQFHLPDELMNAFCETNKQLIGKVII